MNGHEATAQQEQLWDLINDTGFQELIAGLSEVCEKHADYTGSTLWRRRAYLLSRIVTEEERI